MRNPLNEEKNNPSWNLWEFLSYLQIKGKLCQSREVGNYYRATIENLHQNLIIMCIYIYIFYIIILYYFILYYMFYYIILYYMFYSIILYHIMLYYILLNKMLNYIILYCIILYYNIYTIYIPYNIYIYIYIYILCIVQPTNMLLQRLWSFFLSSCSSPLRKLTYRYQSQLGTPKNGWSSHVNPCKSPQKRTKNHQTISKF